MAQTPNPQSKLLGWNVQGDVGPVTYYTSSRNKIVAFDKAPPLSPPSVTQEHFRNLFRMAGRAWQALRADQREWWRRVALNAATLCTGFGLFIWFQRTRDRDQLASLARAANEEL